MLNKLKERWRVNGVDLLLILSTFAIGGSLCGYAGRKLMLLTGLEKGAAWIISYILLVTLLWPFCVLLISLPFGQFSFFTNYLAKMWKRISGSKKLQTTHIAIFASGAGSNAEKIIQAFRGSPGSKGQISLIVCNKPNAGVLLVAKRHGIKTLIIEKDRFFSGDHYLPILADHNIQFIVLAGFLWKVPAGLIQAYPNKIVNIHPALLPKYGGKGMYGSRVHEAVIAAGEKESGITVHFVDELYDHGKVIMQATCVVESTDTPETLAEKIHLLEHKHFPLAIMEVINAK
jgi:formyltetrahydrofolate-dependent phosphoribosylglycinamide formyltransferase